MCVRVELTSLLLGLLVVDLTDSGFGASPIRIPEVLGCKMRPTFSIIAVCLEASGHPGVIPAHVEADQSLRHGLVNPFVRASPFPDEMNLMWWHVLLALFCEPDAANFET